MEQIERNTQRLGSHGGVSISKGKGVAKRPAPSIKLETDALNATNQRPHSRVRSDGKSGSASNPSENQPRTPQESNGTNGTEHSTVGITLGVSRTAREKDCQKTRRLTQTERRPRETQRTKDHTQESVAIGKKAAPQTRARTNYEPSQ